MRYLRAVIRIFRAWVQTGIRRKLASWFKKGEGRGDTLPRVSSQSTDEAQPTPPEKPPAKVIVLPAPDQRPVPSRPPSAAPKAPREVVVLPARNYALS